MGAWGVGLMDNDGMLDCFPELFHFPNWQTDPRGWARTFAQRQAQHGEDRTEAGLDAWVLWAVAVWKYGIPLSQENRDQLLLVVLPAVKRLAHQYPGNEQARRNAIDHFAAEMKNYPAEGREITRSGWPPGA